MCCQLFDKDCCIMVHLAILTARAGKQAKKKKVHVRL